LSASGGGKRGVVAFIKVYRKSAILSEIGIKTDHPAVILN
jgi:hypothetical protein